MSVLWLNKKGIVVTLILLLCYGHSRGEKQDRLDAIQLRFLSDSITSAWVVIDPNDTLVQSKKEFTGFMRRFGQDKLILTEAILTNIMAAADSYGQVMLMIRLANTYKAHGLFNKCIEIIDSAIDIADRLESSALLVSLYRYKGIVLYKDMKRRDHEALSLFLDALDLQREIGGKKTELNIIKRIADYHFNCGDEEMALASYEEIIQSGQGLVHIVAIIDSWNAIGLIHRRNGRYDEALIHFKEAFRIAEEGRVDVWRAILKGNIGDTYFLMGRYDDAIPLLEDELISSKEFKVDENLGKVYRTLGEIYLSRGDFKKADFNLREAVRVAKANHEYLILAETYKVLGEKYAKEGEVVTSMNYHLKSLYLKDSINSVNNSMDKQVSEVKRIYDLRNKENHEAQLIAESAEKSIVIKKQKLLVLGIFFVAIVISCVLIAQYMIARRKKIVNMKLNEQYAIILEQKDEIQRFNENLEREVVSRTRELNEINIELQRYAFMNAHKVRGPLASILGLFYILKNKLHHQGEESEIIHKAMQEAEKMDDVITQINRKLEATNFKSS